jgi:AcrR family transcriptional regulator
MARTRSEKAHQDVVQAALDVLLRSGVAGFTIDEVVARSGVAKTTIYRWWPSRQALLLDVIHTQLIPAATPNTGDTRADLITYLSSFVTHALDTPAARLLPELCSAAQRDPDLADLRDTLVSEKRQPVVTILELARARGELASDADIELLTSLMIAPMAYTRTMRGKPVSMEMVLAAIDAGLAHGARERVAT